MWENVNLKTFRYSEYPDTVAKPAPLKQNTKFFYVLFSESGLDEKIKQKAQSTDLQLFSLETIVNYN